MGLKGRCRADRSADGDVWMRLHNQGKVVIMDVCRSKRTTGFTLMELLVVIAIIALLASILMPSLQAAKALARMAICQATLHNMVLGNGMYGEDNNSFTVHGAEYGNINRTMYERAGTGYGWPFYPTALFDDDWANTKPGVMGNGQEYNAYWNNMGGQNICNVGQLMLDKYIQEKVEAIACPQATFEENAFFSGEDDAFNPVPYKTIKEIMDIPAVDPDDPNPIVDPNEYWRNECYTESSTSQLIYRMSSYVVRGPIFRSGDVTTKTRGKLQPDDPNDANGRPKSDAEVGLFVDWEQATAMMGYFFYKAYGDKYLGVPYWPRIHTHGLNVGYLDGHVALFGDEMRRTTCLYDDSRDWLRQTFSTNKRFTGTGWNLFEGRYDSQQ